MDRILLAGITLLALGTAGFAGLQYWQAQQEPRFTCTACGQIQPEQAAETARTYLDREFPDRDLTLAEGSATRHSCGPCGGVSPTAFLVREGNRTAGFIAAMDGNVVEFSTNLSEAPGRLR